MTSAIVNITPKSLPPQSQWRSRTARYDVLTDKAAMAALYERLTLLEMGRELHCNKRTVRAWLAWHGIPIRGKKQHPPAVIQEMAAIERRHWHAKDYYERCQVSYWRQCILSERCPFMCPYYPCDKTPERPLADGRSGCTLYNRLKNLGELSPRSWEGQDPFEYHILRLAKYGLAPLGNSFVIEDDLDISDEEAIDK